MVYLTHQCLLDWAPLVGFCPGGLVVLVPRALPSSLMRVWTFGEEERRYEREKRK